MRLSTENTDYTDCGTTGYGREAAVTWRARAPVDVNRSSSLNPCIKQVKTSELEHEAGGGDDRKELLGHAM